MAEKQQYVFNDPTLNVLDVCVVRFVNLFIKTEKKIRTPPNLLSFCKTTSEGGLVLNGTSCCAKLRTARSGGSWLLNLQWCPNGQPDYEIGGGEGDNEGEGEEN